MVPVGQVVELMSRSKDGEMSYKPDAVCKLAGRGHPLLISSHLPLIHSGPKRSPVTISLAALRDGRTDGHGCGGIRDPAMPTSTMSAAHVTC